MSKSYKILLAVFLILLAGLVFLEASKPTPINWFPSYANTDKIPLGSLVFFENLQKSKLNIREVNNPPYQFLQEENLEGNYFFLNNNLFLDKAELSKMLAWAEKGNTLFFAGSNFSGSLLDTLKLEMKSKRSIDKIKTIPHYTFSNPKLKSDSIYSYKRDKELVYFNKIDTSNQKILGFASLEIKNKHLQDSLVNFLEVPFGEGKILLHSNPELFSNYFMLLGNNYTYANSAMAYLDQDKPLYWDNHYKSGKKINTSPLYILLNNRYLKWAYYFILIGALLFIYFEGKRKQKSIPIVKAPENKTYDYTRTVAGMYLEEKQHLEIAQKQIEQFRRFLREKFHLNPAESKTMDFSEISQKTGVDLDLTKQLFSQINKIEKAEKISEARLKALTQTIIKFKNKI